MVAYNGYGDPGAGAVLPKNIARMPVLKEITSSSTVSWCPLETHKDLLAAGTVSGTIDDSFQTSSRLMILNASLSDGSGEMQLKGQARVKDADFVRISWGAKGHSDSSMPLGLIAGGMSDGSVLLWDADNIIKGTTRTPIAAKRHGSHVSGLAFHPTEQNLIASGSADSELLIWDLKNVSSPSASPPGSAVATEKSSIVDIAWNLKVAHILACSSSNGQTSVWDLRQKRAVITFTESTHRHIPATALAWDPTQARQLVVSYAYPAAEVWDLRYGMAPKQILQGGHSRGSILTVAWSQFDSNVILTTGEDATTCLWNSQDGQLLDCVQDHGTTFCLKWHPFNAELLAGSTYEGNVTVRSISNTGSHVPEWKGRPCGGIFGFGSRLVTFGNGFTRSTVRSFKVSTEPEFVRMASEFQNDISQIDMKTFCSQKIARSDAHSDERATWEFLRILFDSDSRSRFLSHLGFPPKTLHKPNAPSMPEGVSARVERLDDVSDEDFFNQLSPERIDSKAQPDSFSGLFSPINDALLSAESLQQEESDEDASDLDKEINTLLVVGEIEKATHLCFKNKRMADALTIASLGSVELQHQIQQLYMNSHKKHYIRSIAFSIGSRDIPAYVKRSEVSRWKETLALIMTYCAPEHHIPTVRVLVDRLDNASMNQAAIICSLCCSDVDGAALQWQKQEHQRSGKSRIDALQSSVEKLYVMSQACGTTTGPSASGLYSEYAGLLSAQGAMSMALSFLQIAGSSTDELAFRIYYSGVSSQSMPAPPQPFYVKNVSSGRDSGHPISNRLPNAPGGLRRGPIPSQSSVGDSKPSSVPPQNRSSAPMVAPRGHPPSSMRPSYKPASGPGVAPGARPNSVPPQDSASSSSLPSRHLLNDNTHQGGHMNQFPTSGYNPSVGRAPQDVPSRAGSMPPSRAGASIPPSRGVQSYPPPGRGPSMGHPSPNHPMASRRPPAGPGMERATPSPSMSPAPRPSPSPGRFRPSAGIPPQRGGPMPPQRAGPLPPRGSQPPMQSASGIRHPPSPLRSSGVSPSFPPNQVSRPMPGRPGSGGMVDHQQFSAAAPPSRPGSMAPASRQPSPGPNRPPVRPGGVNGPSSSFPPNSSTGPMPTRPLPNHPPSALNPPPPQSRPAPLRPGITPPSSTPNFPQPSHHPSMNTPSQGQHHPLQAPSRPPNVPPQGHTAAHPGMNPPQRGPNQMQSPFRPGMSGGQPNANASVQPYANSPSPFPATSHAPMPPSAYHAHPPMPNPSRPASGTMPHPNLGRPTSGPNAQPNSHPGRPGAAPLRPSGPFRPSAGSSHLPPNQPPQMPNPARFPSSQSQSSINSLDAAAPRQSPVPFRSAPTRPGIPQPHRPNPNPDSSAPPHQRHQSPFTPSNGPTFQEQPSPFQQQQPHRNQIHQSASQPVLHDSFDGGFDDFTQSAESLPSDAFSDQSQQRVSAPAVPSAHHYSTPQNSSSNSNQHHSPTSRGSPSAPPRSPSNQTRLSPNSSFPRQPSPGRQSPGKPNDLVAVFQSSFADLHGLCNDPAEKTVVDNARLKFESEVYERITSGSYSASAMKSLESLANALQSHNKSGVQQANIALITDSWAEVKSILPVIKSIVEVCKKLFS